MKEIVIATLIFALVVTAGAGFVRVGPGYITTDLGGWNNHDGLFICPANRDADGTIHTNPLAPIFPELVIDC